MLTSVPDIKSSKRSLDWGYRELTTKFVKLILRIINQIGDFLWISGAAGEGKSVPAITDASDRFRWLGVETVSPELLDTSSSIGRAPVVAHQLNRSGGLGSTGELSSGDESRTVSV
jgi:hypothetical protein